MLRKSTAVLALVSVACGQAVAAPVLRSSVGPDAASILSTVDLFRADISLGGSNNGNGGSFAIGRREINWDGGANSNVTTPLAANGFNGNPVQRGALYSTPGTGFIQSARIPGDDANPNLRFGDINATYDNTFKTFSAQKLFAANESTITDVRFFIPNSPSTPATVGGFGVVFTDVDLANTTRIELFDPADALIGSYAVPVFNNGLSFLGISFDDATRIGRVRITAGNCALSALNTDDGTCDVVAMDDFFYSEPLPTPGSAACLMMGGLLAARRRR